MNLAIFISGRETGYKEHLIPILENFSKRYYLHP